MAKSFTSIERFLNNNYDIRLNEISNMIECKYKEETIYYQLNENSIYRNLVNSKKTVSMADLIAILKSDFTPRYNPIITYFNTIKPYTNKSPDYIAQVCNYITVKGDKTYFESQFKKMLIRCVACGVSDQVFNKQAFILVGEKQNTGKTTFLRWLCPPVLKRYYIENISIDKDSLIALAENWFINMDELANLSRLEINSFKSYLSKDYIKVRRPYERSPVIAARIANLFGSTNKREFLTDETGNVRWICFEVDSIDFDYSVKIDVNQMWAQAYYLYLQGEKYQLTADELTANDVANKLHSVTSAEQELIIKHYEKSNQKEYELNKSSEFIGGMYRFYTASDFVYRLSRYYPGTFNLNVYQIGRALKALGFEQVGKYDPISGYTEKGYYVFLRKEEK